MKSITYCCFVYRIRYTNLFLCSSIKMCNIVFEMNWVIINTYSRNTVRNMFHDYKMFLVRVLCRIGINRGTYILF